MPHPRRLPVVAVLTAALFGSAACGSSHPTAADGSPGYLFERADAVSGTTSSFGSTTLEASLPNRVTTVTVDGAPVSTTFSDAVVLGTVARVERSEAVTYSDAETQSDEPRATVVDWNDPAADERSLLVTLTSVRSLGGGEYPSELTFRLGVLVGSDPAEFMKAAERLGEVAVLLRKRPDGRHQGEWIPALGPAGIGVVDSDGSLTFPGMGASMKTFQSGIDSVAELEQAASTRG